MRFLRSWRSILLALALSVVPASSFAGVLISVGFAPPVLPVYVQPPCPEPGYMWTPGYWAYGDEGYYWVPGAWVPAPYMGALWTPPYWGWSGGLYVFHTGYWGPHVGFYGGVNYGFGYMGVGFAGGAWHGREFAYNTAVVNINRTVIHNTYVDRTVVERNTIVNDRHVAYSGGPGGIQHRPSPIERSAMSERHVAATSFQRQHVQAAQTDRASYVKNNGGHPQNLAVARPMSVQSHASAQGNVHAGVQQPMSRPTQTYRPNQSPQPGNARTYDSQARPMNQSRPAPESRPAPAYHQAPQPQYHPAPQQQSRPAPQNESRPAPRQQEKPRPEHH